MFDFLKRKKGAPDIGKEDEGKPVVEEIEEEEEEEELPRRKKRGRGGSVSSELRSADVEKLKARIDSLSELLKGHSERFSTISEQIGEVRAMSLSNEKQIARAIEEGSKAADVVKEIKPEKLQMSYQKIEAKINQMEEKLDSNKEFIDTIMGQLKELKKKDEAFVGTQALLNLNKETKENLIDVQKVYAKTRISADKSENIFIELKRGFSEYEKIRSLVGNLQDSVAELKKEVDSIRISKEGLVQRKDLSDFEKIIKNKISFLENEYSKIDLIQREIEKLDEMIESSLSISQKNSEEIGDIAVTLGDDNIKQVSDFEDQISEIVTIIEELANRVDEIKGKRNKQRAGAIKKLKKRSVRVKAKLKKKAKKGKKKRKR
jgi:chromosome segregation ATPase